MIYLDLGNTALKIGFQTQDNKTIVKVLNVKLISYKLIKEILDNFSHKIKKAWLCSVNLKYTNKLINIITRLKIKIQLINHQFIFKNLTLELNPLIKFKEVGINILLNTYLIANKYQSAILVSLGSATVITQIIDKTLEGVILLPGIKQGVKSFFENISLINKQDLNYQIAKSLATNTKDALSIGIINGNYYGIIGLINDINRINSPVFYTGGDLKYFQKFNLTNIILHSVIEAMILIASKYT